MIEVGKATLIIIRPVAVLVIIALLREVLGKKTIPLTSPEVPHVLASVITS